MLRQFRQGKLQKLFSSSRRRGPILRLEVLEDRTAPAVYTVNLTTDNGTGVGNSGDLRYCISKVNGDPPGLDTIQFQIGLAGSVQTINLTTTLTLNHQVFLDGWSQGGGSYSGPPLIALN